MLASFSGTLSERDRKRHIVHEFEVPPGMARLELRLTFAPPAVEGARSMLCLTVFDPQGFRGAGHRGGPRHVVTLAAGQATPGYLPGPLAAGRWSAVIDTHMVAAGAPCSYTLEVNAEAGIELVPPAPDLALSGAVRPGPAWFRGDLHAHTTHSDASWGTVELLAAARQRGLDFATITDHNTTAHLSGLARLSSLDLLVMGGMELTTFWGHALSLGTRSWIDWRVGPQRTMPQIAAEVGSAGGLFVIAHPCAPGDPHCTGCDWRYAEMMPGPTRHIEIWNGLWAGESNNEAALALWYSWLNEGFRVIATAGTDAHGPAPAALRPGFNVVWADELSEAAILAAVARGSLYLSSGPTLDLTARAGDHVARMGGALPGGPLALSFAWDNCPIGALVRLIAGGELADELIIDERDEVTWEISEPVRWYAVEVRADDGELLAISNPVFVGEWGEG